MRDVAELLATRPGQCEVHARLGSSADAREAVCAAIYAALAHPTFEQAVRFAVCLGGDTDTVAAMTGAISGAIHGGSSVPRHWLDALEDGDRGRTYVEQLATRLLKERVSSPTEFRSSLR